MLKVKKQDNKTTGEIKITVVVQAEDLDKMQSNIFLNDNSASTLLLALSQIAYEQNTKA